MTDQLEREDKYEVPANYVVPGLDGLGGPAAHIEAESFDLDATYYDTEGSHLQRRRITMRRRTGGHDAGWHVKLPAGTARTKIHLDVSSPTPPDELVALLTGVRGGRPLVPVVQLSTRRTTYRVLAGDALVVEVADDQVSSRRLLEPRRDLAWREVEVELGAGGSEADLTAAGLLLREAGARQAASVSKLGTAMGEPTPLSTPGGPAGLVTAYLRAQVEALAAGDLGLRRGDDTVYPMRVAVRRLRSTVRTFEPLLDPVATRAMKRDLRRLAAVLGPVRDHDVLARHFTDVAESDRELAPPARLAAGLAEHAKARGRSELMAALSSAHYQQAVTDLDDWYRRPPTVAAATAASAATAPYVDGARTAVDLRRKQATTPGAGDVRLHELRKAYKRLRYALELALPDLEPQAAVELAQARAMQDLLGEHQDAVVALGFLATTGADAGTDLESLVGAEQRRRHETRRRALEALATLPAPPDAVTG